MKKIKNVSLFAVLLLLLITQVGISQVLKGTVKGKVSTQNGQPLTGVNVGFTNMGIGDVTNPEGKFIINNVPPGTYTLKASYVGFNTVKKKVTIEAGETTTLNIILSETINRLNQLVVPGTMRKTYVKDPPVKVQVVSRAQLMKGKVSSNIMDLISSVTGVSTQLNCGVCGTNAIRINGVEGPNTAVLIDGMPILGALATVYGLNGISPMIIDQVEVLKGPHSTLYGTSALGGVVNIITKNPAYTPSFTANAFAESTRELGLGLAVSQAGERLKGFVSANLYRRNYFTDDNNDEFNDMANKSRIALFAKGSFSNTEGEKVLTMAGKLYGENRTGGVRAFSDEIRGSDEIYGESIYTKRGLLLLNYSPAGIEQLQIKGSFTYHDQDSYYGTTHYVAQQQISYGQASWSQSISEKIHLLAGATLRYYSYNDNTPATDEGKSNRLIPGVFARSTLSLGDFAFTGGLRADYHRNHGYIFAPRLAAKYSPTTRTVFRVNYGTGFRVVNVFTESHAALTGTREVVFAEDLQPERARSISASIQHIIPFGSNPLTITVDGFYTYFSNKIHPDYSIPNKIVYANLHGHSVTRGFSISLKQNFTVLPITYNVSLTYLDVFIEEHEERKAELYSPEYLGNFGLTYYLRDMGMSLSYAANLVGSKRMPVNPYVKVFGRAPWSSAFITQNIKITKEFSNVNGSSGVGIEAYFAIENIGDFTQDSPLVDAAMPFSPQFSTIYTWGPIVGRTFSVGVRLILR